MDYTKEQMFHLTHWVRNLKKSKYKDLRFKRLINKGYPPFYIPEDLIDTVELEEFVKEEENRLPLLIGTQMGIYPQKDRIEKFNVYNGLYAVLGKSMLSGAVAGLLIYLDDKKIDFIPNE